MKQTVAQKVKAKRARRPLYLVVRRLMDPDTGELLGAFVPANGIDQRLMRERRYGVGTEVRAEMKKPRNVRFFRLAHALGNFLVDHMGAFAAMDGHSALRRLQREAGVCCDTVELDLGPLGLAAAKVPQSLAFVEMEEGDFAIFWWGVTDHLRIEYARGMSEEEWAEAMAMIEGDYA